MTKLTFKCSEGGIPCHLFLDDIDISEYVYGIQLDFEARKHSRVVLELIPMELDIDIPNITVFMKAWSEFKEKQQAFSRLTK